METTLASDVAGLPMLTFLLNASVSGIRACFRGGLRCEDA